MTIDDEDVGRSLGLSQLSRLWSACLTSNTSELARLIETLNPAIRDLQPGLSAAIDRGLVERSRYLIERGVALDSHMFWTALRQKSIPMLDLMIREFGWDVNARLDCVSAMPLAVVANDIFLVCYLLSRGANPNFGQDYGPGIGNCRRLHVVPTSGRVLQAVARCGNIDCFDMMMANGAVLANASVVHAAVQGGSLEMVIHVLDLGADINQWDGPEKMGYDFWGRPVLRAISMGRIDLARLLVERGADVISYGREKKTALDLVREDNVMPDMRLLIEAAVKEQEGAKDTGKISR